MIDKTTLKTSATQKPEIAKPGTAEDTKRTIKALITKVNKPKVKIVIGKVRISKTGLSKELTIPNARAAIKADSNETTTTALGEKRFIK